MDPAMMEGAEPEAAASNDGAIDGSALDLQICPLLPDSEYEVDGARLAIEEDAVEVVGLEHLHDDQHHFDADGNEMNLLPALPTL